MKLRAACLDGWFREFFSKRIEAEDRDRPPISELVRRVDERAARS